MPPDVAARASLAVLLEPLESALPPEALPDWLLEHQADAVVRARAILARFGGVLIADGVGLGKTYIALALAALERAHGGDAMAIVPASLRGEWQRACRETGVTLPISGHSELAHRAPAAGRCTLLLVDEAHAFRNPRTRRYDGLARLAIGRRVALLSATPLNNGTADLAALLHLFAARDRFREFGVADVAVSLQRDREAELALAAVSVCRTRRLVEHRFPTLAAAFPRRVLLPPVRYDITGVYGADTAALIQALSPPAGSAPAERGAALMHLSLVRRLESSPHALRRSLLRQRAFLEDWDRARASGVALTRPAFRAFVPRGDGDDTQLVMWPVLADPSDRGGCAAGWRRAVDDALSLLPSRPAADPKLAALDGLLDGPLHGVKTIVFTEYRDTALYLLRHLRRRRRVIAVMGDGAWAGVTRLSRQHALDAFAPHARGRRPDPLLDADVLVATDVASEGMNLQDAAAVVNYDLPWNPVRVMQRVGRIDRLHSLHDTVRVAHVIPGGGLAALCGVLETLRSKLDTAAAFPGAEPDPLASLWWLDAGSPEPEALEREAWRRVAPFESRERWRMLIGPCARQGGAPLIGAGLTRDGGGPQAGVLLALEWPDGRRIPLPYIVTAGRAPRRDAGEFARIAERALAAEPIPAHAFQFTELLAAVLPDARHRLVEYSAARQAAIAGPGRRAVIEQLRSYAARLHRTRGSLLHVERALAGLCAELPAGLDRLIGRIAADTPSPDELARRVVELLHTARTPPAPDLGGLPKLRLQALLVIAA